MKIYTKKGDQGLTFLYGRSDVPKDDLRLQAFGTIDELNSGLGLARAFLRDAVSSGAPTASSNYLRAAELLELDPLLHKIQNELFNLGSQLATVDERLRASIPPVLDEHVVFLEKAIDRCSVLLPPLAQFILPGGAEAAAALHLARTICRRAERICVSLARTEKIEPLIIVYLNRLSDALFTFARLVNTTSGIKDVTWEK